MAHGKYEKYIVTELKPNIAVTPWHPPVPEAGKGKGGRIMYLDSEVVPGAFYVDCVWIIPGPDGKPTRDDRNPASKKLSEGIGPHAHDDYDEVIAFFGTDMEDPKDLGAEIELWLEDEKYILTKTCIVFVPRTVTHCPLKIHTIKRPVFHFTTAAMKIYYEGE